MPGAGKLRYRLRFEQRGLNANGDRRGPWEPRCTVWADIDYQRGSETAVAQRIESKQPASITVRESSQTRPIAAAWRAIRVDTGETFNITTPAVPGRDPGFLNMMAVSRGGVRMKTGFRNKGKVLARFDKVPIKYRNAVRAQGTIEVADIVAMQKRFAPEDDGVLKSTIKFEERHRADKLLWVIKAGGAATTKPVRNSEKGNAPEFDYAVGVEHGTADMAAQPYFYVAYRLRKKKAKRRMKAAGRKALKEA